MVIQLHICHVCVIICANIVCLFIFSIVIDKYVRVLLMFLHVGCRSIEKLFMMDTLLCFCIVYAPSFDDVNGKFPDVIEVACGC